MNRISMAAVLACTALIACNGGEETDTDTEEQCTNSYQPFPESGELQAYYRTSIEAKLQTADTAATLAVAVAGEGGAAVAGSSAVDGSRVTFTPSAPLAPATKYTATLTYECGESSWDFTTSEVGGAVTGDLTGKTFSLDLASGRFVHPEGVGDLIGQFLTTQVLVGVTAADATSIDMIGAIAVEESNPPVQDTCTESIAFPTADFAASPYFEIDATGQTTNISVAGFTVGIDDLQLSGAFAPDASYIAGARLAGNLDTYPLATLVDATCVEGSEDYPGCLEAVCELAAVIGGCEDCGNGEVHCLSLEVDSIGAEGVAGTLVERTTDALCADTTGCPDYDRTACPTAQ